MIQAAIITRRLKDGKTYEDFRKAWYHTIGFGTANKMYTIVNGLDPRGIIVIGFTETSMEQVRALADIDIRERRSNPLDEVIEPEIGRTYGILVAEDDFSSPGSLSYMAPSVGGKETDLKEVDRNLQAAAKIITEVSQKRDHAHNVRK
jgi:hypothetical protein